MVHFFKKKGRKEWQISSLQHVHSRYSQGDAKCCPKVEWEQDQSPFFSSNHHFPDPIPNATPTSDPHLATTLRGTRVNRSPETKLFANVKDSGKACNLTPSS